MIVTRHCHCIYLWSQIKKIVVYDGVACNYNVEMYHIIYLLHIHIAIVTVTYLPHTSGIITTAKYKWWCYQSLYK